MIWVIFVLAASFIWSITAIINRFCRVRYIESSIGYLIFIFPTCLFALITLLFEPFMFLPARETIFALSTGVLTTLGYYFYLEAIHKEELSRVYILFGVGPLFVLVLSSLFLKEALAIGQYIAFALIFTGSTLISFKRIEERIKLTFGALLVFLSSFAFAAQDIVFKHISSINLATMMIYREAGYILSIFLIILLFPSARRCTKKIIHDLNLKQTSLVYSAEIIGMIAFFFIYLAIQRGPVSLVKVTQGFETIFVFILVIFLSSFFPKILKEELSIKVISIKIAAIALMLAGLYLIVAV
ncbi:DMT family transporter [Candidatus Woesearchaeota archaeon]|nr:DMT family transporter [Candidatus Woesearchaeota archaeon]